MRQLTPAELSARSRRNVAIAGVLIAFVVLVFGVTVLKLSRNQSPAPAEAPAAAAPALESAR